MNFDYSDNTLALRAALEQFMDERIYPNEKTYRRMVVESDNPRRTPPLMQELRAEAKAAGLWNLFLPDAEHGAGLTNLEYAPLAEVMGRVAWAPEVFNCNAPDTGNMEVLAQYGDADQQAQWLTPLLAGEIQSGFAMTEPAVASSDATNVQCSIARDGEHYVINGRKWFTSGAWSERCKILIVMGKTDADNPDRHRQQSMVLVPLETPGVEVVRPRCPSSATWTSRWGTPKLPSPTSVCRPRTFFSARGEVSRLHRAGSVPAGSTTACV